MGVVFGVFEGDMKYIKVLEVSVDVPKRRSRKLVPRVCDVLQ